MSNKLFQWHHFYKPVTMVTDHPINNTFSVLHNVQTSSTFYMSLYHSGKLQLFLPSPSHGNTLIHMGTTLCTDGIGKNKALIYRKCLYIVNVFLTAYSLLLTSSCLHLVPMLKWKVTKFISPKMNKMWRKRRSASFSTSLMLTRQTSSAIICIKCTLNTQLVNKNNQFKPDGMPYDPYMLNTMFRHLSKISEPNSLFTYSNTFFPVAQIK